MKSKHIRRDYFMPDIIECSIPNNLTTTKQLLNLIKLANAQCLCIVCAAFQVKKKSISLMLNREKRKKEEEANP